MSRPVRARRVLAPTPERLAHLAEIHAAAFAPDGEKWSAAGIASFAANGALIATEDDSGFALLSLAADEAELLTIAVAPLRQRAGLGGALLDAALAEAGRFGATIIYLEVAADNEVAKAFYRRRNFMDRGRRPGYYARPEGRRIDALLLSRPL